jgi:hypothetical protein
MVSARTICPCSFLFYCPKQKYIVYFIYYGNEGTSSAGSDADRYVIIKKLLGFIFEIIP